MDLSWSGKRQSPLNTEVYVEDSLYKQPERRPETAGQVAEDPPADSELSKGLCSKHRIADLYNQCPVLPWLQMPLAVLQQWQVLAAAAAAMAAQCCSSSSRTDSCTVGEACAEAAACADPPPL